MVTNVGFKKNLSKYYRSKNESYFLDIDEVLNSDEYFEKINNLNVNGIEKEVDVLLMHEKNDISKYFVPKRGTAL